jgi:site-specific DNA recombinase
MSRPILPNGRSERQASNSHRPTLLPAAIYARVSTEDQGKGYSIPTQLQACRELAQREGYEAPESHICIDDGVTGTTLDRPALRRLRALVTARAIHAVIVLDPDRLSRTLGHLLLLMEELQQSGVQLLVVAHPIDCGAEGMLLFHVRGAMAEYERAKLQERTTRGRLGRAKAGHVSGGTVALGYRAIREPHKAHWEIDEEESALVQRIYQLSLSGLSTWAIARLLTQEGVLTSLDRGRTNGKKTLPAGTWQPASVHKILTYEPYCTGVAHVNKYQAVTKTTRKTRPVEEWIDIQIPPIVDRATFDAVQHQLDANRHRSPANKKHDYLLSGRFRCGRCRRAMAGYAQRNGTRRYRCSSAYDMHAPTCSGTALADEVESQAWGAVERVLRKPKLIAAEIQKQHASADDERASIEHELSLCEKALARCDQEAQRWARAYAAEVIDLQELRQYRAEIDTRRQSILEQQRAYQTQLAGIGQHLNYVDALTAYCKQVARRLRTFSPDKKRLALDALDVQATWMPEIGISLTASIHLDVTAHTPSA